jgi:GT2 family glycosyltransferase
MQGNPPATSPSITAIVVLYQRTARESEAVASFLQICDQDPGLARHFSLLLYDNSPEPQSLADSLGAHIHYVHDPSNGGLAPAYNYALSAAANAGCEWLLLLDQDTTLTAEYFVELLEHARQLTTQSGVAAIVPKLWAGTRLYSPEIPFLVQIRKQFSNKHYTLDPNAQGVQQQPLTAYNSGAVLRISALQAIGGFPEEFWLDYLDHAIFQSLHLQGYRLCVMQTVLQQRLSHMDLNEVPLWRHWSVLSAQTQFVLQFGNFADRLFFRWWLLKTSRTYRACDDKRIWRARLKQGFLLKRLRPRWTD